MRAGMAGGHHCPHSTTIRPEPQEDAGFARVRSREAGTSPALECASTSGR